MFIAYNNIIYCKLKSPLTSFSELSASLANGSGSGVILWIFGHVITKGCIKGHNTDREEFKVIDQEPVDSRREIKE